MAAPIPSDAADPRRRYLVLALLWAMAAIAYVQRAAVSVPTKEIAATLQIEHWTRDMGRVQSAWYLGYALLQIPAGWLADRWGSRRTVVLCALSASLFTALSGMAPHWWWLLVGWTLMGAAQAGAFPSAAKAIGQLFPRYEQARAAGVLASGMTVGGAVAAVIAAHLLVWLLPWSQTFQIDRWRGLFALLAVPGLVWSLAFIAMVSSDDLPVRSHAPLSSKTRSSPSLGLAMVSSSAWWLLCLQQFFRAAAMVFFLTWFPSYLQETRGVSLLESGGLTTLAGAGGVIGSLAGGVVSDWLFRRTGNGRLSRQGIAVIGMMSCAVLILVATQVASTSLSVALISLGVFCATFGGVSGYTVAIAFGGRHVATVFSSMNMCGNLGAALFPVSAGWYVERTGNWHGLLFLFAGIMAIDAVCWALLNPRRTLCGEPL